MDARLGRDRRDGGRSRRQAHHGAAIALAVVSMVLGIPITAIVLAVGLAPGGPGRAAHGLGGIVAINVANAIRLPGRRPRRR